MVLASISAQAKDVKFVYTFKKLVVGSGRLEYKVEDAGKDYKVTSNTEIYLFGSLSKKVEHISYNNLDLTPYKNVYCQWPKAKDDLYSCAATEFYSEGRYEQTSYNADQAVLQRMSLYGSDILALDMNEKYQEFDSSKDKIFDLAAMFLVPRFYEIEDMKKMDFYLALSKLSAKLQLVFQSLEDKTIEIKFVADPRTDEKILGNIPKKAILDPVNKVVTELHLSTAAGLVRVKLDRKQSKF